MCMRTLASHARRSNGPFQFTEIRSRPGARENRQPILSAKIFHFLPPRRELALNILHKARSSTTHRLAKRIQF